MGVFGLCVFVLTLSLLGAVVHEVTGTVVAQQGINRNRRDGQRNITDKPGKSLVYFCHCCYILFIAF